MRRVGATLLALLILAAPSVLGQDGPGFELRIDPAGGSQTRTLESETGVLKFAFNVTVEARGIPPQSQAMAENVEHEITVTFDAPVSDGWRVGDPPDVRTVRTGDWTQYEIQIEVFNPQAADAFELLVQVAAQQRNPARDTPLELVYEEFLETTSPPEEQTVKLRAERDLDAFQSLASFAKANRWWLVGAGAAFLILGAVVATRRGGGSIVAATETSVQEVVPGRGASFPVAITNNARSKETVGLSTSAVPEGWSAILPVERVEVGPKETTTVWLTLKSPPSAKPGGRVEATLFLTASDGAVSQVPFEAHVVARYTHAAQSKDD